MTEPTADTDHDLLIRVSRDVSHLRDDVAGLDAAVRAQIRVTTERDETRETRLRKMETTQVRHGTRWRFFGWAVGTLGALSVLYGLVQIFT